MEVTVSDMMKVRERRAERQRRFLEKYNLSVICFTMNIAGPIKNNELIYEGFREGIDVLSGQLKAAGFKTVHFEAYPEETGNEAYFVVDGEADKLSRLTREIEDFHTIGSLFDMDVIDTCGAHIGRESQMLPARKCLICGRPAKECARSRRHSVRELQEKTSKLLKAELADRKAKRIAELAGTSLLYEVCTTPKPGLVDRENNGSHKDMDCFTFVASAAALQPYFEEAAGAGIETAGAPAAVTFERLVFPGKLAEADMYNATGGVNTHKGAIFSIGLLCAALGRLSEDSWNDSERVCAECAAMAAGLTERDLKGITFDNARTAGEKSYAQYGITGARGEAEKGFPTVLNAALPKFEEGLERGLSLNDAGCAALLALIAAGTDTNLISRSDRKTQVRVSEGISELLGEDPFPSRETLEKINSAFAERNLSPGGSADLLAVTYFLHFLKEKPYGLYDNADKA